MIAKDDVVIQFTINIIVEPDDDEFHAFCPALKGLHVGGHTEEEAVRNAVDAGIAYLESLIKHREPIPLGVVMQAEGVHAHTERLAVPVT